MTVPRIASRVAVAAGKLHEKRIEAELRVAVEQGVIAWWAKNEPTFRAVGRGKFLPVAAGGADFAGVLTGGLAFSVEAKSTGEPRFYRSAIPEGQARHLDAVAKNGGLAVLAVQFRTGPGGVGWPSFALPWGAVPWAMQRDALSISVRDVAGHELFSGFVKMMVAQCVVCGACWPRPRTPQRTQDDSRPCFRCGGRERR